MPHDRKDPPSVQAADEVRRRLLRSSAALGGLLVAGQVPYEKPAVKSFFGTRAAWAQATVVYAISCTAEASLNQGPGTACQNAVIANATARVTPVPPAGTLVRCTPATTDPNNSQLSVTSVTTLPADASGAVAFAPLDLTGNVPNPPLAVGSVLTLTVTFVDQAAFGLATCTTQFTIVDCST